jgi:hypothetical protein
MAVHLICRRDGITLLGSPKRTLTLGKKAVALFQRNSDLPPPAKSAAQQAGGMIAGSVTRGEIVDSGFCALS